MKLLWSARILACLSAIFTFSSIQSASYGQFDALVSIKASSRVRCTLKAEWLAIPVQR